MEWKTVKCKECNTTEGSMFLMQPPLDGEDTYCEKCRDAEVKKRAEAKK